MRGELLKWAFFAIVAGFVLTSIAVSWWAMNRRRLAANILIATLDLMQLESRRKPLLSRLLVQKRWSANGLESEIYFQPQLSDVGNLLTQSTRISKKLLPVFEQWHEKQDVLTPGCIQTAELFKLEGEIHEARSVLLDLERKRGSKIEFLDNLARKVPFE